MVAGEGMLDVGWVPCLAARSGSWDSGGVAPTGQRPPNIQHPTSKWARRDSNARPLAPEASSGRPDQLAKSLQTSHLGTKPKTDVLPFQTTITPLSDPQLQLQLQLELQPELQPEHGPSPIP